MAFDFLGTFNKSQFERFLTFARTQLPIVDARINWLRSEQLRVGSVSFRFDGGTPVEYAADPADSYIGRLLAAYLVLGGSPLHDLRTRTMAQPVFIIRGSEGVSPAYMSNGEVIGARGLADASSSVLIQRGREWLLETLRYRFDRLERKIRRALDYRDQLDLEANLLLKMKAAVEVEGSLESVASQIQGLLTDPNYRAIFDDAGKDPFGLTSYAPFSSYDVADSSDPAVSRTADAPQRQNSGFVPAGGKS